MTLKQFLGVVFVLVFLSSGALMSQVFAAPTPTSILGGTVPPPVSMSPIGFFNIILNIVYIAAGIYVFFNILVAGFRFLGAADKPETLTQVKDIFLRSLIGLLLIVVSTVFAALIGWLFYDSPTAILRPKLAQCQGCVYEEATCNSECDPATETCEQCEDMCGDTATYKCVPK